jgi:hypothetical protein
MKRWYWLLLVASACLFAGCSDGPKVTKVLVELKLDNQPLTEADVRLVPKDDPSLGDGCGGRTAADGKVEILVNPRKPLRPGRYVVLVTKMVGKEGAAIKMDEDIAVRPGRDAGGSQNVLATVYNDKARSPLIVTLTAGDNSVPLVLKKQP